MKQRRFGSFIQQEHLSLKPLPIVSLRGWFIYLYFFNIMTIYNARHFLPRAAADLISVPPPGPLRSLTSLLSPFYISQPESPTRKVSTNVVRCIHLRPEDISAWKALVWLKRKPLIFESNESQIAMDQRSQKSPI
jgi:hypothetical protein